MERKNSLISDFLIPVGYTVLVYAIWEGIGFFVSFVVGKMTENWTNSLNNTYVVTLLQEISVFLIMYVLFHKKVDFVRDGKSSVSLLSAFAMLIFPLIQIGDDLMAIFLWKKSIFSILRERNPIFCDLLYREFRHWTDGGICLERNHLKCIFIRLER